MVNQFKDVAIGAAREAAKILMSNLGDIDEDDIETKNKSDFVTWVDKSSEKKIIEIIHGTFPTHKIYAEESAREKQGGHRWIIDPLDGTTNYIHGVPIFSVSIGLEHDGELLLGVVYDPNQDELFYAEKGGGAFLNDIQIHVSKINDPELALLATGYPFRAKQHLEIYQQSFKNLFLQVSGIRRAGSAALDLSYIACGRFDGFWELDLKPWDLAAAAIILNEAGGSITDFSGGPNVLTTGNTIASNSLLHPFLLKTVQAAFSGIVDE